MKHSLAITGVIAALVLSVAGCPNGTDPNTVDPNTIVQAVEMFAAAGSCTICHEPLNDPNGQNVAMGPHWRGTMMANAARDPYWQAKVAAEVARTPALAQVIEDTCARCHMPMARTQIAAEGASAAVAEPGLLSTRHEYHQLAIDGVSCTLCHQIRDDQLGQASTFSGAYPIDTTTESPDRLIYGPFDTVEAQSMASVSGFVPAFGPQVLESSLCATCHTLFTPTVDQDGNVVGQFPEQTAFLEWRHGQFGDGTDDDRACQDCHMPAVDGDVPIASVPAGLAGRSPFAQHHFVGGNTLMLSVLADNRDTLGVTASPTELAETRTRTLNQLTDSAADAAIDALTLEGDQLIATVTITNKAGHKLPTGFPARRIWIHLTVTDGSGATVFESGAPQPDGTIAGNDADTDLLAFEPHFDEITDPQQVQIYQPIMVDSQDQVTRTLLRAASYIKDNRLLPAGFDKAAAQSDIAAYGQAVTDENFIGGSDQVTYRIDVTGSDGPFTLQAELLYQSVATGFIADMRSEESESVTAFISMMDQADHSPTALASTSAATGG